ncbi:helix-turn-helix transcriptional regulator [Sorangium sp. So ce834]|uniref:helix-turn-helix domain-containing protein n=1 Tax=Sorangium sp. So ce834 TaxID=3133321 RepID=UPI003F5E211E
MSSARVNTVLRYVAANVRRIRLKRDMTQEALAEAADLHLTFIQRIEAGRVNPSVGVLVQLADALEVSPALLLRPATMPEVKRGRPRKVPK